MTADRESTEADRIPQRVARSPWFAVGSAAVAAAGLAVAAALAWRATLPLAAAAVALALLGAACGWLAGAAAVRVRMARDSAQALRAHEASEARLRAIVDTAVDAIVVINEAGVIQSVNPATVAMFGHPMESLLGENVSLLMPEPHRTAHPDYLAAYLRTGQRRIIGIGREVEAQRRDGTRVAVDLAVAEWTDGRERFFTGMLRDVSARKLAEAERQLAERRELAVRELRHRINNMFSVINTLVVATARSQPDVESYRDALLARVSAFGAAQTELARQGWTSRSLRELVGFELRPYADAGASVVVEGAELLVAGSAAENLSMVVHELATNAVKYGALSRAGGSLSVTWRLGETPDGEASLMLDWLERGGPLVVPPRRQGFGATVIAGGVRALSGVMRSAYEPEGFSCHIALPASRVLATPSRDG